MSDNLFYLGDLNIMLSQFHRFVVFIKLFGLNGNQTLIIIFHDTTSPLAVKYHTISARNSFHNDINIVPRLNAIRASVRRFSSIPGPFNYRPGLVNRT